MTLGEIERAAASKQRLRKIEAQEKATYDYIQACLIIRGVGIALGSKEDFPTIEELYPNLFATQAEEKQTKAQQAKNELSVLRFKQFAQSYNQKYKT